MAAEDNIIAQGDPNKIAKRELEDNRVKPILLSAAHIMSKPSTSFSDPNFGHCSWKTLLSSSLTSSDSMTAGIATCPAAVGYLAHHRHEHAEIYFILEGEGMMTIENEEKPVAAGDVVFIPGNAEHGIRNVSSECDVVWFYCFAADRFEDIKYRFS